MTTNAINTDTMKTVTKNADAQSCLIELGTEAHLAELLSGSSLKDKLPAAPSTNRKFWIYEDQLGQTFHITISHALNDQEYRFRRSNGKPMTELEFEVCEEANDFLEFMQNQDYAFIEAMAAAAAGGAVSSDLVAAFKFYAERMHCDTDRLLDLARENSMQLYNAVRALDV